MGTPALSYSGAVVRWWHIALIGIIIIISGTDVFFWTSKFIDIVIALFALLALGVGVAMVIFGWSADQDIVYKFPIFFAGVLTCIVALIELLLPGFIAPVFVVIMAFIAIINSILLILVGCSLPDVWKTRLVIVLLGMITLFLSILMGLFPALTPHMLVKIWGIYAWVLGGLCLAAGILMKLLSPAPAAGAPAEA